MKITELTFEQITDKLEGRETKRKVLFVSGLKKAIMFYLSENPKISLVDFTKKFINENNNVSSVDRVFTKIVGTPKISQSRANVIYRDEFIKFKRENKERINLLEETKKKEINTLFDTISQLNDRIRILEGGEGLWTKAE